MVTTLCGEVNNRGQQLENLILKNYLILFNDKNNTYFHSASDTFTSIYLTLCSPSLFLDLCGSDHFPILLENDGPPSMGSKMEAGESKLGSAIADDPIDDPMSLFTSILKDIAEEIIPKTSSVPKCFNKPWFSDICKERFKREPTEGNLNAYRIARAKARRDIRHSKKKILEKLCLQDEFSNIG